MAASGELLYSDLGNKTLFNVYFAFRQLGWEIAAEPSFVLGNKQSFLS